jgi:porin
VKFTQQLTDHLLVYAGKINLFDAIKQPLTGAGPLTGFQNTSLIFNMILARTLPYSSFGAGMFYTRDDGTELFFSVYDANNTRTTSGFESFFDSGVVLFGGINVATQFFGLPGHQGLMGSYSTSAYTNLQPTPYLDPIEGAIIQSTTKTGSWCLAYNFDQAIYSSPDDPKRMWGVFGKFGIADNNPNPIQWTASAGISGASPFSCRKLDTFGVGYFFLGVSGVLKQSASPATPLRNEEGVEIYYNARITPWFQVTPDFQVIVPFQQQASTATVFGLRAKLDF